MSEDQPLVTESERDIHSWFELTYANYLVLPRSVLQSMPLEWQERFTGMLRELHDEFGYLEWPAYNVQTLKRDTDLITVFKECEVCDGEGAISEGGGGILDSDCPACDGNGTTDEVEDHRYETPEEVGFRDDPIPHYWRGRTRLQRASEVPDGETPRRLV